MIISFVSLFVNLYSILIIKIFKIKKDLRVTNAEVDSLTNRLETKIISEQDMIRLIKEVPAWKTLRIEEISDKERISINALEEKED